MIPMVAMTAKRTSDDDNDGVFDNIPDVCTSTTSPTPGALGWISTALTDYDGDGCKDDSEDLDDDNDGICDSNGPSTYGTAASCVASSTTIDECVKGAFFTSSSSTDHDTDGCKDTDPEDPDDDNDGVLDGPGDGFVNRPR